MIKRVLGTLAALLATTLTMGVLSARAQDVASLTGIVTDKDGGTVSDAVVKLVDTNTGANYATKTGDDGTYRFLQLSPGPGYTLTINKDGFQTVNISNLYLPIATTTTRNVELAVGAVKETIEVKAEGSVSLNTTDSAIGNNFDLRAVADLPSEFRDDPAALLRLQPGVVSAQGGVNADPSGSRDGSVAGARADQNNITVDGIDATDFAIGQAFATQAAVPLDSVQEFSTQVGNPTAAYGRGSGAQTIITTKSGTNVWHGAAFEYNRTAATEANTFFNNKNSVPRTNLVRNQFGANLGGAVKKDKLFFFFDYEGRRDAKQANVLQIVPLGHVKNGGIAYVNALNSTTNQPCSPLSRLGSSDTSTACVTILTAAQVAALDPCSAPGTCSNATTPGFSAAGFAPALLSLFNTRYPQPNDLASGDGLNTAGFRFNAPNPFTENIYTTRIDYNINSKHKMFTRFNFNNSNAISTPIQFPGDPVTAPQIEQDNGWVLGETWIITPRTINQFTYGESRVSLDFPVPFNGNGNNFPLNWFGGSLSIPFARQSTQSRLDPVPTFRDDATLVRGKHSIQVGGEWKPIRIRSTLGNAFNFVSEGLGGNLTNLPTNLQPPNLLSDPTVDPKGIAASNWNNFFVGALGFLNEDQTSFIYEKNGTALPLGAVERRDYRYYTYAFYGQDSWKVRSSLTVTAGLRYQYDSVPYESNGLEATFANTNLNNLFAVRTANGLNSVSGPTATPQLKYQLAGKANPNAPSLYGADKLNFSPRLAIAWNPGFRNGLLGSVFGDHKTVVRLSAAQIYDQTVINAVNFIEDQASYLFGNTVAQLFGTTNGATPQVTSLLTGPRYTGPTTLPFSFSAPPFQNPLTPNAIFNYGIDPQLKTPYSNVFSAGVQRELHGGFQLEVDYYGRFGRRLFTLADAAQPVDFIDPASKQGLIAAFIALELAARNQVNPANVTPQPFFENQIGTGATQFVYGNNLLNLQQGNLGSALISILGLVPSNVGLPSQFLVNALGSNKGWSSYNGLLVTLRKRLSHNLQFDFNYTFSHSIDNSSIVANNNGNFAAGAYTVMCNPIDLNVCRGNSEFDATHQVSSNFVYDLPIGRGQSLGGNSARWLDEVIGGWQVSGIVTWRTGLALPVQSGVSTTSLAADNGALFTGSPAAVSTNLHTDTKNNNQIQFFTDATKAAAAFSPVTGLQVGNRDTMRGPHFSNADLGVAKNFRLSKERYRLIFRADAFNAFNHPNFALPNTNINTSTFGVITATVGQEQARVLQMSLRFTF
jgi:Carboxypeptidase regulatory-like domain